MRNYDYHHAATEIMALLNTLSLHDWAQKIADSILRSDADTETLITLRHTLKDLKEKQLITPEIDRKVNTLIIELSKMIDPDT